MSPRYEGKPTLIGTPSAPCRRRISAQSSTDSTLPASGRGVSPNPTVRGQSGTVVDTAELEGRLSDHSQFGSDLDGGTADAADLEQPTFPPRDRDEEHGELPELPHPRPLRGVVATRAGSRLPRAEVLLFRAEAEDEEHRASLGRRAVSGRRHHCRRRSPRSRSGCRRAPVAVIPTTAKPGSTCAPTGFRPLTF